MYGPSPQDELDRQKALTAKYKQDLSLTVQENRKLHAIIIKSVQESDPYDDSHFSTNFAALENKIFNLVKKHFSANGAITGWYEYDSVKESDDRDFFLQAHIATATAQALFSHEERLFGLDERTDRHLAAFETLLQDSHISTEEIMRWRIQTIKVAALTTNKNHDNRALRAPRELLDQLKHVHTRVSSHADWPSARDALDALFEAAYNLALSIRSCKAEYEWKQTVSPALLNEPDIYHIDGYDVGAGGPTGQPVKIMFGPVYKRVESGKLVMLRNGTVLYG